MRGLILVGGQGSRLRPITYILNKNLLPIYDKPAIFYALELLKSAGVRDLCIVGEHNYIADFEYLLGGGADFDVSITYYNDSPLKKGPVSALLHATDFFEHDSCVVLFADNIFDISISEEVKNFKSGAHFFFKEIENPKGLGVAVLDENKKLVELEEKPEHPKSNLASTGLYIFDKTLTSKLKKVEPTINGEYLIPSVINAYIKEVNASYSVIKGFWRDMGTFDGLYEASKYYHDKAKGQVDNRI